MKTVIGLFDELHEAQSAVTTLLDRGVDRSDVSVVAHQLGNATLDATLTDVDQTDVKRHAMAEGAKTGAGTGAIVGTGVGGVLGFLAGIGTIFIPGIGPIIAAGPLLATLTGAGVGAAAGAALGGLVGALTQVGVPEHDAHFYAEAVRRGGTLVIVTATDDMARTVADVMSDAGAIDVDKRREHFTATGFTAFNPEATPYTADQIAHERNILARDTTTAGQTAAAGVTAKPGTERVIDTARVAVPVLEEELKVGKRLVEQGRVQIYSHVVERPVSEQVTLREEHVVVERRPVDRPVTDADMGAFKEGSMELTEYAEEAVVQKEARVVEEVVVGREVTEHTEVVRDTVRRTDVEVVEDHTAVSQTNKKVPPPPPTGRAKKAS
jgi:uncharacterized protein (TIGR02271 family)